MSSCLTGTQSIILQEKDRCNLGFYCRNSTDSNPPEYCPPTVECQITRLGSVASTCEQPQGLYEPIVCKPGYYCPSGGKEQIPCPGGHFCTVGSFLPTPCSYGAICPPMSQRQIATLPLGVTIAIDLLLLICIYGPSLWNTYRRRRKSNCKGLPFAISSPLRLISDVEQEQMFLEDLKLGSPQLTDISVEEIQVTDFQKFIGSLASCINTKKLGLSFAFEDLGLELKGRNILAGATGCIESGSMWGVMGASGAGKSTFLNLLMGKAKHTSGNVYVNGVPKGISGYKKIIGYVPQDDIILSDLTVRENILHSARVRLPSTWTDQAIQAHVDALLECLNLAHVQHSLVGDATKPIISGGQRKRVSIGVELAAAPMALFLDEPTSGLDATSALSVMKLLKSLSRLGVTVVSIIHQPRTEIFYCLDDILLLGEGRQLYQGKASRALGYFQDLGFEFHQDVNPADTIMDIISGQGHKHSRSPRSTKVSQLIDEWRYRQKYDQSIRTPANEEQEEALRRSVALRGASWPKQVWFCFFRSITQQIRQAMSFYLEISVGGIAGLLIGLAVFSLRGILFTGLYQAPYQVLSSAANYTLVPQLGMLCGLAIGLAGSAPGVKIFGEEKLLYWREASAGHSRSAYYVGKVLSTFFRITLSALHFTVFFTLMATPLMSFGRLYVANVLYFYCIYGLASCVSVVTRREDGPLLSTVLSLIIGSLCGYGPPLATIQQWHLEWFWRACPGTWFTEAYFTDNLTPLSHLYNIEAAAQSTGYTLRHFPLDVGMLVIIGTVYRVLAFLGLVLLNRDKQL